MAKKSMKERELKRQKTVARFAVKRAELKAIIANSMATDEEVWAAQRKLQKLPRDSSAVRLQRRCRVTGRPHAVYRKFGLSRVMLREEALKGNIPGVVKASW